MLRQVRQYALLQARVVDELARRVDAMQGLPSPPPLPVLEIPIQPPSASQPPPPPPPPSGTAPSNTVLPAISGTPREGQVLSCSTGTWLGTTPLTFQYQWISCDATGANCADISGRTQNTYVPVAADQGRTVKCRVTASNAFGSATVTTAASALIQGSGGATELLPSNTGFEVDMSEWQQFFDCGVPTRSTAQKHSGVAAAVVTPSGGKFYIGIDRGPAFQLTLGVTYIVTWWVRVPTAMTYDIVVGDGNGHWESRIAAVSLPANTWVQVQNQFTAGPWEASIDTLTFRLDKTSGTFAVGDLVYFDDMSVVQVAGGGPPPPPPPPPSPGWPPVGAYFAEDWSVLPTPNDDKLLWAYASGNYPDYASWNAAGGGSRVSDGLGGFALDMINPSNFGGAAILSAVYMTNVYSHAVQGEEVWYRDQILLPTGYVPSVGAWNWLMEWHEDTPSTLGGYQGIDSIALSMRGDGTSGQPGSNPRLFVQITGGPVNGHAYTLYTDTETWQLNRWYDILVHVKWHSTPSLGLFELWLDGRLVGSWVRGTLLTNGSQVDSCAHGLYHYRSQIAPETHVRHRRWVFGPTRASVGG
jgi:hypothetical protein